MKLKSVLDNLDGLSQEIAGLYQLKDGKYHLDVEGLVQKTALDEFRNSNIALNNQLKQFTDLGLDVNQIKEAQEAARKVREKELIEAGDVETLVQERIASLTNTHKAELETLNKQLGTSNEKLSKLLIDNTVRTYSTKSGVLDTAVDDVLLRARSVFTVENGELVAKDSEGKPLYGADGKTLTVDAYVTQLGKTAPHLFKGSTGTGANQHQQKSGQQNTGDLNSKQKIAAGLQERA